MNEFNMNQTQFTDLGEFLFKHDIAPGTTAKVFSVLAVCALSYSLSPCICDKRKNYLGRDGIEPRSTATTCNCSKH